jgi:hypothetical protein
MIAAWCCCCQLGSFLETNQMKITETSLITSFSAHCQALLPKNPMQSQRRLAGQCFTVISWTLGDFVRACLFFDHVEDLARAVPRAVYYVTMWETIEHFNGNSQCMKLQPNERTVKTVFRVHMTLDASFPTGFRSAYQWNWKIYKKDLGQGSHTGTTR